VTNEDKISATSLFWDANPCDGQNDFEARKKFRYLKEPWILPEIEEIARKHRSILEIGCGQGVDGLIMCGIIPPDGRYVGLELSKVSLDSARQAAQQLAEQLNSTPLYRKGNAENLGLESDSFECVYSMGVLHHTPDIEKAVREVHRVLAPGGKAYIALYRTFSPKILAALLLRWVQGCCDKILSSEKIFYKLFKKVPAQRFLGTALLECFGVPILHSFTHREIHELFSNFEETHTKTVSLGLPTIGINKFIEPLTLFLGSMWFVEATKGNK
jgi:ubiquinone/menaquinone biosynthesis C-methylase UbiE